MAHQDRGRIYRQKPRTNIRVLSEKRFRSSLRKKASLTFAPVENHEKEQKIISTPQLITIRRHLKVLKRYFLGADVTGLRPSTANRLKL